MDNNLNKTKQPNTTEAKPLSKNTLIMLVWCLALALFWVAFLWGFWKNGVYALGLNAFIFFAFTLGLFVWILYYKRWHSGHDLFWIIPLALIALSYLIYDNPFLKTVNMLVYPVLGAVFINYGFLKDKEKRHWDLNLVSRGLGRIFSFLGKLAEAVNTYIDALVPKSRRGRGTGRKIVLGVGLFLIIAVTIIIPLLTSADPVFGQKIDVIYGLVKDFISVTIVYKCVVFLVIAVVLFACALAWGRRYDYTEKEESAKKIDAIVSGIVLGGILAIYLLFLWVQVQRLWVGSLPFEFRETEALVKSGFWQLFFLTGLNTLIYFFTYRKTNRAVQNILIAFTFASLLLLVSAGQRMALYVIYYGFSYEKFFASYTVIYSAILFLWLISRLFIKRRADIFKFLVFLFLWMFAFITVFPVEQFILRANVALSRRPDSRIRLFEMTMLSPDVLGTVKKYNEAGVLKESAGYLERENEPKTEQQFDWGPWTRKQQQRIADKHWYEKTIVDFID